MYSNKLRGTSGIEYFIVIILLISFLIIGVVIASSVFHFAILPSGIITSGSGSPVQCNASVVNVSTVNHQNEFKITISDGSPGLVYSVYANNINSASNPSSLVLIGNYTSGINTFSKTITIEDPSMNTIIIGNTTGSNVSIDGVIYSAGGECQTEIAG